MTDPAVARQLRSLQSQIDALKARRSWALLTAATYTPTYLGATTPGATTYSAQQGWYWRIDSLIFVTGLVAWTAATGTGNANISLPVVPSTTFGFRAAGSAYIISVTFTTTTPQLLVSATSALFTLASPASNAASNIVQVEAAGTIAFSCFYGVD